MILTGTKIIQTKSCIDNRILKIDLLPKDFSEKVLMTWLAWRKHESISAREETISGEANFFNHQACRFHYELICYSRRPDGVITSYGDRNTWICVEYRIHQF